MTTYRITREALKQPAPFPVKTSSGNGTSKLDAVCDVLRELLAKKPN